MWLCLLMQGYSAASDTAQLPRLSCCPRFYLDHFVYTSCRMWSREGLEVHAWLDESEYPKSRTVSDKQLLDVKIQRHEFHGEWNYTIIPNRELPIR
ncbi:MAG: ISAzo13-like element transposase-related protein [Planctomycetaceae bacterium]